MNIEDKKIIKNVKEKLKYLTDKSKKLKELNKCKIEFEFQEIKKNKYNDKVLDSIYNNIRNENISKIKIISKLKNKLNNEKNEISPNENSLNEKKLKYLKENIEIIKYNTDLKVIINDQYLIKIENIKNNILIFKKRNNTLNKKLNSLKKTYLNNKGIYNETFNINREYFIKIKNNSNNIIKHNRLNNFKNNALNDNLNNINRSNINNIDNIVEMYLKNEKYIDYLEILRKQIKDLNNKVFNYFTKIFFQKNLLNNILNFYKISKKFIKFKKEDLIDSYISKFDKNIEEKTNILKNKEENFPLIKENILEYLSIFMDLFNLLFKVNNIEEIINNYYNSLINKISNKNNEAINIEKSLTIKKKKFNSQLKIKNKQSHILKNYKSIIHKDWMIKNLNKSNIKILNIQKLENLKISKNKLINEYKNEKNIINLFYFICLFFKKVVWIFTKLKEIMKNNISFLSSNDLYLNLNYWYNNYSYLKNKEIADDLFDFKKINLYLINKDCIFNDLIINNPIIKFYSKNDLLDIKEKKNIYELNEIFLNNSNDYILNNFNKYFLFFKEFYLSFKSSSNNKKFIDLKLEELDKRISSKKSLIYPNQEENSSKINYQRSFSKSNVLQINNKNFIKKITNNSISKDKIKNLSNLNSLLDNYIFKQKNGKTMNKNLNMQNSISNLKNMDISEEEKDNYYFYNYKPPEKKEKIIKNSKKKFNIKLKEYNKISKNLKLINNEVKHKWNIFKEKYYVKTSYTNRTSSKKINSLSIRSKNNNYIIKSIKK